MLKHHHVSIGQIYLEAQVQAVLARQIALGALITYKDLAACTKTQPHSMALLDALGGITQACHKLREPPSTAIVVQTSTTYPGSGFFKSCRQAGWTILSDPAAERAWWEDQLKKLGVKPSTLSQQQVALLAALQPAEVEGAVQDHFEGQPVPQHLRVGPVTTARLTPASDVSNMDAELQQAIPEVTVSASEEQQVLDYMVRPGLVQSPQHSGRTLNPLGFGQSKEPPAFREGYLPAGFVQAGDIWELRKGNHDPRHALAKQDPRKAPRLTQDLDLQVMAKTQAGDEVTLQVMDLETRQVSAYNLNAWYHLRVRCNRDLPTVTTGEIPGQVPAWVIEACRRVWDAMPLQQEALKIGNLSAANVLAAAVLRTTTEVVGEDTWYQILETFQELSR